MNPDLLVRSIEEFLVDAPNSVVIEDGQVVFDMGTSHYSVSQDNGKCLVHFWSQERNSVRRVLDSERKNGILRLQVQKFGQAKPHQIEICRERDQRTPSAKKAARAGYQRLLHRILLRNFPDYKIEKLSSAMNLERSFGPIYTRGFLRKGRSAFAVLGVNVQENQSGIDAALTLGLLWLDLCRERESLKTVVEGLRLFVPQGKSAVLRARAANLNPAAAKFHIHEIEERDETCSEVDISDGGNIATRLVRCPDLEAAHDRFAGVIVRMLELVPTCDLVVLSSSEISFRLHGLEFARARSTISHNFKPAQEITFGAGQFETILSEENEPQFADLMLRVCHSRQPQGDSLDRLHRNDALFRMQPERWLESLIIADVAQLDSRLDSDAVYSQVPAFAASDRAMIDVLTATRSGRLAVIELKADEDIHLPLQGLDYWARVNWHHQRGEFQRYAYFPGKQLSSESPLLYLVSPALRIHPATDILLRYISPKIEYTLIGIDENWREGVRSIFKKRRT